MVNEKYKALLGEEIGSGSYRTVYAHKKDPRKVIKHGSSTSNKNEHTLWKKVKDTRKASAFARVYSISKDGSYLVMERIQNVGTLRYADKEYQALEKKVSSVVDDLHSGNIGLKKGKAVVVDYGNLV